MANDAETTTPEQTPAPATEQAPAKPKRPRLQSASDKAVRAQKAIEKLREREEAAAKAYIKKRNELAAEEKKLIDGLEPDVRDKLFRLAPELERPSFC